tara:strand:- start:93 stop:536 length:444 start_codon:yes stop_codon:yes gene_type:complete
MTWYANSAGRHGLSGAKGDAGEKLVELYCKKNNLSWEDKNDYKSQVIDKIDCIIENEAIDVKTNIYMDRLAVELYLNNKKKVGLGWLFTTKAKKIYGVDLDNKKIYSYNVSDMIEYVDKNRNRSKLTKHGDEVIWVHKSESFITELQ